MARYITNEQYLSSGSHVCLLTYPNAVYGGVHLLVGFALVGSAVPRLVSSLNFDEACMLVWPSAIVLP